MKNITWLIIVVIIAALGQIFTLGVMIWQFIVAPFSFWFWFSLVGTMGYGFFIAAMNDLLKEKK